MRSPLLLALCALAPVAAQAEVVPLTRVEQVQRLCSALGPAKGPSGEALQRAQAEGPAAAAREAALEEELSVTLPPGEFRIADADASTGTLTVDTTRAFRLFKGKVVLYPVDDEDLELALPEGAGLPREVSALSLVLTVRPGQDTEPGCTSGKGGDVVMGVEVLSAVLTDRAGAVVARLDEDPSRERAARPGGKPIVEIEPVTVEGPAALAHQLGDGLQPLKPRLTQCYQASLGQKPGLDGTLVLGFELGKGGKPGEVTVMADSVQDEPLARCAARVVAELSLGKPRKGEKAAAASGRASVSLRFERR